MAAPRRRGLEAEILVSLAVVMVTATAVLGALLVETHEANVGQLQRLAARSLLEEARAELPAVGPELRRWWLVDGAGRPRARGGHAEPLDAGSLALAIEARQRGAPLLQAGRPWEPVRFAVPGEGGVAVARLAPAASGWVLIVVLLVDVAVFTAFGLYLLRARLVLPLRRLAAATRAIADGDLAARVPAEGPRETWALANAFNEMTEALEARSGALEKAVVDLRESNRSVREARAGLDRAERLAAVGCLAAGVAHEVGNPLGAMLAFLDLARRDAGLSEEARGHLERAGSEGQKVRGILRALLDFSQPPRVERAAVDLAAVCRETSELVSAQRRYSDVSIEIGSEGEPPAALADRNTVAQIVLNLLLNAGDALRDTTPKPCIRITVRPAAASRRRDDADAAAQERRSFDAVECVIADNGPGIPEDDRERVFDPFYTTKPPGEGTGLGLSNALRFAEELDGTLTLSAHPSSPGATFTLTLPAVTRQPPGTSLTEVRGRSLTETPGDLPHK
jgi:signal transduction histidine kinase